MILHLLRMRRNVNRNVFNDRKNVSATSPSIALAGYYLSIHLLAVTFYKFIIPGKQVTTEKCSIALGLVTLPW